MLVPNRFIIKNFMEKKLNAILGMPEHLNSSELLLKNAKQEGELLKEEKKKKYEETSVQQLM